MADTRSYIVNEDTGLACRFYSRLGNAYTFGDRQAMWNLLTDTANKTAISDRFFITTDESAVERIPGSLLWKYTGKSPLPPSPFDNPLLAENAALRKEIERLTNRVATLGRKLLDAGGHE